MLRSVFLSIPLLFVASGLALAQPAPPPAEAPDTLTAEARRRFDEGVSAMGRQDFEAARVAFLQTYALKKAPEVLRNLGVAEVLSGRTVEGARHLSEYLRGSPSRSETPALRQTAENLLAQAEEEVGRLSIAVDVPGATIIVDGEAVGISPIDYDWHVAPGTPAIVARRGDSEARESVHVAAGARAEVALRFERQRSADIEPSPKPRTLEPSLQAEPPPARDNHSLPLYLLLGTGAATLASGALWFVSENQIDSADQEVERLRSKAGASFGAVPCVEAPGRGSATCTDLASAIGDGSAASDRRDVFRVLTGVFAAASVGAAIYWVSTGSEEGATQTGSRSRVGVWFSPAAGRGGAVMRF